ncbi:MAG TPA: bifunctional (p)ppGpp synthetase/guanosine-3',5'-bis(diphosphate) 3'-pyrophosphohydrolase [Pseudobdellovibrionaceae bacterium]|nr:bifunctional (p)ppGpp synthetase/guanosine-3',5'-bis(diphosphate) 3'-pyrophosphohydrolase [Pseudobdellovibrionaceae bacterium]
MAEHAAAELLSEQSPESIEDLLARVKAYDPSADLALIEKAYKFSERAHDGQFRRSGEPYVTHPLGVAAILAELRLDSATVITGLLHDTVEDTHATLEDVEREFGKTVAELVDGVTKISRMSFRSTHEKQGENIRKMIVAMGKDVRVVLVKLADRLHNMRSLSHMPYEKQLRIAQETLDIYAPLAGRLGIMSLKIELEDLSLRFAKPDMYYQLASQIAKKKAERERYIDDVKRLLTQELSLRTKIKFDIFGRPKHLYSIYKKMQSRQLDYEQIHDLLAFRVIVDTVSECYEVLGHVHALFKPVPGRFKDFIAMPKVNNYQSLHTTVIGPGAERIEIQIRTRDMHLVAERGIAAHWKYKEGAKVSVDERKFDWLRDLVSLHQQVRNADEFLETVKTDLFDREIYVFTPKGEVRELPDGATPIDFAYAVHTDVGHHCAAARVNGRQVPLKTRLKNGDTIEIITSPNQQPSKDWLKNCVTTRAKSKIRWWVTNEERKRALELGQDLLEKEFAKYRVAKDRHLRPSPELDGVTRKFKVHDLDDLHVQIGYGKLTPLEVLQAFVPDLKIQEAEADPPKTFLQRVFNNVSKRNQKSKSIIKVDGMDDLLVRFARCCNPIPGDPILGFITRGRGITIHRSDCERAFEVDNERRIDVEWTVASAPEGVMRNARLRVISQDIPGLLKSMTEAFAARSVNILNVQARTTKDRKAVCQFEISVRDTQQLTQVTADLQKIPGIIAVDRF